MAGSWYGVLLGSDLVTGLVGWLGIAYYQKTNQTYRK